MPGLEDNTAARQNESHGKPSACVHVANIGRGYLRTYRGDLGPVVPQLFVPRRQVLVCLLAGDIEAHDTRVRLVVVRGMHRIETLLTSGVPKVDSDRLAANL